MSSSVRVQTAHAQRKAAKTSFESDRLKKTAENNARAHEDRGLHVIALRNNRAFSNGVLLISLWASLPSCPVAKSRERGVTVGVCRMMVQTREKHSRCSTPVDYSWRRSDPCTHERGGGGDLNLENVSQINARLQ